MVFTGSKHLVLAVDAGGSSTRAIAVDSEGVVAGYGRAGSGNPTSAGPELAGASIAEAARRALSAAGAGVEEVELLAAAMAGAGLRDADWLTGALAVAGLPVTAAIEADLTALYLSGSLEPLGCALIVGTGTIAARVRDRRIEAVSDGLGWLVGDAGSGFWIGARALRAAAADLDGRAASTALTAAVLAELEVVRDASADAGPDPSTMRGSALSGLLHAAYGGRPVELARLSPLVFAAAAAGDAVARRIAEEAAEAAAQALRTVLVGRCPVVLGGGVIAAQPAMVDDVRRALRESGADDAVTVVPDGVVGAGVLALGRAGVDVDDVVQSRIRDSLAGIRG